MELVSTFFTQSALVGRPPHEIFCIARRLLENIELWTQGARARDEDGHIVRPHDARAVQWSLNGVLAIASNPWGITPPPLLEFLDAILREWSQEQPLIVCLAKDPISGYELWENCDDYNDQRPHRFILALLDEAIARTATIPECRAT